MNIYTNTYDCFWKLLGNMDRRKEHLSLKLHTVLNSLSADSYFRDNYSQAVAYDIFRKNFKTVNEIFCSEIAHIYSQGEKQPLSLIRYPSLYDNLSHIQVISFDGYLYTFAIVESDTTDTFIVLTGFQKFTEDLYNEMDIGFDYTPYLYTNMKPSFIVSQKPIIYKHKEEIEANIFKIEQYTYINTYNSAIDYKNKNKLQLDRGILKHMVQQIAPYINRKFLKTEKIMRVNGFLVTCLSDNIILIVDYNSNPEIKNKNYINLSGNSYVSWIIAQEIDDANENRITMQELTRLGAFCDD